MHLFKLPHSYCTPGPSGSGKTSVIGEFLRFREQMFSHPLSRVIYCYPFTDVSRYSSEKIKQYKQYYENIQEHNGLPQVDQLHLLGAKEQHVLVVLDDLSAEVFGSPEMAHLFSNVSTHERISGENNECSFATNCTVLLCDIFCILVILVTQNPFPNEKHRRGKTFASNNSLPQTKLAYISDLVYNLTHFLLFHNSCKQPLPLLASPNMCTALTFTCR